MDWAHQRPMHLVVYDSRLGRTEEKAGEAVIAVWPANSVIQPQDLDVIRLARGLTGLCSHFSAGDACEVVTLKHHHIVLLQVEPSIFFGLHVPTLAGHRTLCTDLAKQFIRSIYRLFVLLHQSIQAITDVRGYPAARSVLSAYLQDFLPNAVAGDGWCTLADMYTPLSLHRGLPIVQVKSALFIGIQAMAASMAIANIAPGRPNLGTLVLYKQALIWSTLSGPDTQAVYLLASRTTIPITRNANKSTEISKIFHSAKGTLRAHTTAASRLDSAMWKLHKDVPLKGVIQYAQLGSKAPTGELDPDSFLVLHLQSGRDACRMVPWQQDGLQVIVLVAGDAPILASDLVATRHLILKQMVDLDACAAVDDLTTARLSYNPSSHGAAAAHVIGKQVEVQRKGHIQGARYTYVDSSLSAPLCRASPPEKLTNKCSTTAIAMTCTLWQDCSHQMRSTHPIPVVPPRPTSKHTRSDSIVRSALGVGGSPGPGVSGIGNGCPGNTGQSLEVLTLGPTGKWVAAHWGDGNEVLNVCEAGADEGLHMAGKEMQAFTRQHFPGAVGP